MDDSVNVNPNDIESTNVEPTPIIIEHDEQPNDDRAIAILSQSEIEDIWKQKQIDCDEDYCEASERETCFRSIDSWKEDRLRESERYVTDESDVTDDSNGGGCLIATATYGSELAPQVQ